MTPAHLKMVTYVLKGAGTVCTIAGAVLGNEVLKNDIVGLVAKASAWLVKN